MDVIKCLNCDLILDNIDNIRGTFKYPYCNKCFSKKFDGSIFKYLDFINKIDKGEKI